MKLKALDCKNDKSFKNVITLYKKVFGNALPIPVKRFHKYAYQEHIFFKTFYDEKKFAGFVKGFYENDLIYLSFFVPNSFVNSEYESAILSWLMVNYSDRKIVIVAYDRTKAEFYEKLGYKFIENLSFSMQRSKASFISNKPELFDENEAINGVRKYDWPLMFISHQKAFIYYANIHSLKDEKAFKEAYHSLPQLRKEKVDKFKFYDDKVRSLSAWILLRKAMKIHHIDIDKYEISLTDEGKPYLKECPCQFSISHSGDYVMVGISKAQIGVDIQEKREIKQDVSKIIFNEIDEELFTTSVDKTDTFYKIWTFKESRAKLLGKGFLIDPKLIRINYLFMFCEGTFMYEYNEIANYKMAVNSQIREVVSPKELDLI